MVKRTLAIALFAVICAAAPIALAQMPPGGPDMSIDESTRAAIVDAVVKELADFYVFPDAAAKMGQAIRQHQQQHKYDAIVSAQTFAQTLTTDLREVTHDRHLSVGYYGGSILPEYPFPPPPPSREQTERMRAAQAPRNFGFEKVERLAGNIGYLDLRAFMPPSMMGDTAAAAMTFLSNTDALIIDLRQNGGGSPDAVSFIASYFFDDPQRLNDIVDRPTHETRQFWTSSHVPGRKFIGKDLYILTSNRTFSAAEDFTYGLKNLKRAVIVGEVTGGGAHPVGMRRLSDHFALAVPVGRSLSPITHTDWEGTGVEPDIAAPAAQALARAHLTALQKRQPNAEPSLRSEVAAAINRLTAELGDRP
jgi:retinol-binding protein 3